METLDGLVEAIMDIAREERIDDARIIIRDRIVKHFRAATATCSHEDRPAAAAVQPTCPKCKHSRNDLRRRGADSHNSFCIPGCGCECVFPALDQARAALAAST